MSVVEADASLEFSAFKMLYTLLRYYKLQSIIKLTSFGILNLYLIIIVCIYYLV